MCMILRYGKATRRSRRCARLNSPIQRKCGATSPNSRKRSLPQKAEFESWINPARYSFPWGSRPRVFSIQPKAAIFARQHALPAHLAIGYHRSTAAARGAPRCGLPRPNRHTLERFDGKIQTPPPVLAATSVAPGRDMALRPEFMSNPMAGEKQDCGCNAAMATLNRSERPPEIDQIRPEISGGDRFSAADPRSRVLTAIGTLFSVQANLFEKGARFGLESYCTLCAARWGGLGPDLHATAHAQAPRGPFLLSRVPGAWRRAKTEDGGSL